MGGLESLFFVRGRFNGHNSFFNPPDVICGGLGSGPLLLYLSLAAVFLGLFPAVLQDELSPH